MPLDTSFLCVPLPFLLVPHTVCLAVAWLVCLRSLCAPRYDQLFVALGAHAEVARALARPEWLLCLVNFAIMRHIQTEQTDSVATALVRLLDTDMKPKVDPRALHDANDFRRRNVYVQGVTEDGLTEYVPKLKKLFDSYAAGDGAIGDVLHSKHLLEVCAVSSSRCLARILR